MSGLPVRDRAGARAPRAAASPLFEPFERAARAHAGKAALVTAEGAVRYETLYAEACALATGLDALGVRPGDAIGVLLPNGRPFVLLLLAAARIGAVIVPQSTGLATDAIARSFAAAGVRHAVAWHGLPGGASEAWGLPPQGARIVVGGARAGWQAFDALLEAHRGAVPPSPALEAGHPYLMVLTSGSTGAPKPIVLSQDTKLARARSAIGLYGVTPADVTLACTPLYHSLAQRLVLIPLLSGGTSVLMEHFTPAAWIEAVRAHAVSFSIAVSSQLRQLLAPLEAPGRPLESLRCLVSSSALLDADTKAALYARLRCEFHECYGASEVAIATNLSPADAARRMGSVGRAIPEAEVRVVDGDGHPVATGTAGEIVCRTSLLHSGYHRQPEATARSMSGEWFRTGDLGRMDEEGFLTYLGRIKDIIISGGVNVYPKDVEDVVGAHPAVRECAAVPVADEALGEVIGVVVACDDPASPPSTRDLQRLCVERLGDAQQPRHWFFVDALPKTALGKIDKPRLRARYSGGAGA